MWMRVMPIDAPAADRQLAALRERPVELRDLVSLGEIRIEIILAGENGALVHVESERERRTRREFDRALVQHGQRAREARGRPGRYSCSADRRTKSSSGRTPWCAS